MLKFLLNYVMRNLDDFLMVFLLVNTLWCFGFRRHLLVNPFNKDISRLFSEQLKAHRVGTRSREEWCLYQCQQPRQIFVHDVDSCWFADVGKQPDQYLFGNSNTSVFVLTLIY